MILLLFLLLSATTAPLPTQIVSTGPSECLILHDGPAALNELLPAAIRLRFSRIRIQGGEWDLTEPVLLENAAFVTILAGEGGVPAVLLNKSGAVLTIRQVRSLTFENLVLDGGVDMLEKTRDVSFRSVTFNRKGLSLKARSCNQPNECVDVHKGLVVENSTFVNCDRGIYAERLESSWIRNNRFVGAASTSGCDQPVGIEVDGKTEDLDRRLEYGHVKTNHITGNSFEQPFSTGIRLRYTQANVIRENEFEESYRAMEFLEGARYNQVLTNHIGYLSETPVSSACPVPCGIYAGAGAFNNVFYNNFFEQDFELQFLERHRNHLFVVDESGGRNVFRSDFLKIQQ
ncbi:MAG TPA: right-handed parallel beta-helix repeat-containing protein [Acidobacteriota bacterium]|nr:right-handed parallel beta-helix repeat-containing protein [Acidobacteriota bacterium]